MIEREKRKGRKREKGGRVRRGNALAGGQFSGSFRV